MKKQYRLIILFLILALLCGCAGQADSALSPSAGLQTESNLQTSSPLSDTDHGQASPSATIPEGSFSAPPSASQTPAATIKPTNSPSPSASPSQKPTSEPTKKPTPEPTPSPITGTAQKYDYTQLMADISLLSSMYPDKITVSSIGTTNFEREIPLIILGNPSASKRVLIHGAMHAREYITSQVIMLTLERYLRDYDALTYNGAKYSDILSQVAVYIVPMVNPDGVELVNNGIASVPDGYRDIVLDINKGRSDFSQWKANGVGVDLNNNYGVLGSIDGKNYASVPASMGFPGESAFSEPETIAIADLTSEMDFLSTASYHTKGEIIYWYFGQTGADETRDLAYARELAKLTDYSLVSKSGSSINNLAMGYKDWFVLAFNRPGFTIECGQGSHPLKVSQLDSIYQAVKYVPIHMAWREYEAG